MVFVFQKASSATPFAWDMDGHLTVYPPTAQTETRSQWSMPSVVREEATLHWGTTRSGTPWLSSCKRPAVTSPPSQSSSHSVGKFSSIERQWQRTALASTFVQAVSGRHGMKWHTSMYGYSTRMQRRTVKSRYAKRNMISHARTGEAACVWGTGEANRTRHAHAIGVHLHGRCRPRGYPVPEAARKPAREPAPDGLQPTCYGLAKMSALVRPPSLFDSDWWWRWRRNVSFSLSASLSLFSDLTLSSHAHLWSLKTLFENACEL